jgi:hypothetical protein
MLICANHTVTMDPMIVMSAMTRRRQIHFMAKAEWFEKSDSAPHPFGDGHVSGKTRRKGHRGYEDAIKYLHDGETVAIFPRAPGRMKATTGRPRPARHAGAAYRRTGAADFHTKSENAATSEESTSSSASRSSRRRRMESQPDMITAVWPMRSWDGYGPWRKN